MQAPDLNSLLNGLEQKISSRDAQLAALENALLSKKLDEQIRPDGRPVRAGHISSYFGERQDPFNGHQAFHKGIDFASPKGSEVMAVAAGVVTFAGEKTGYGTLVEVSHGNGLTTRYGHNQGLAVGVGRTVARGDTLAFVGSTGRSTGPHVHFEVLKERPADRSADVHRAVKGRRPRRKSPPKRRRPFEFPHSEIVALQALAIGHT